jgi:hypothetical protein
MFSLSSSPKALSDITYAVNALKRKTPDLKDFAVVHNAEKNVLFGGTSSPVPADQQKPIAAKNVR